MAAVVSVGLVAPAMAKTLPGLSQLGTKSIAVTRNAHGLFAPAHPGQLRPTADAASFSTNWAGYVDTAGTGQEMTGVNSSFVVPSLDDLSPGFAATWAGIGGYTTQDLIQAGVEENYGIVLDSGYYAWYEVLPADETEITSGCVNNVTDCGVVEPGDDVTVAITQTAAPTTVGGPGTWLIKMVDSTEGWTYENSVPYASSYSSAEWIQEAITLAGVQTIMPLMANTSFGSGDTYTEVSGGSPSTQAIVDGSPVTLGNLDLGVFAEATPSALGPDGKSFNVCDYALLDSCAAPTS